MRSIVMALTLVVLLSIGFSITPIIATSPGLQAAIKSSFERDGFAFDPRVFGEQDKLIASNGADGDSFGNSVALDGDTALIGAYTNDEIGTNAGSVYVFVRTGTTWTEQAKLTTTDVTIGGFFGFSVALDGDTALIGAYGDVGATGSAFVFVRNGSTWTQQTELHASDIAQTDAFGYSVALEGNTAIISSNSDDNDNGLNAGSVYIFTRSGSTWTEQTKLTASDGAFADSFGARVALDGNTVLITASEDDDNGFNSGSVYVFVGQGATWNEQAKLIADDGESLDNFGDSVALYGDTALIGAGSDDDEGLASGSAYVFLRTGTNWAQQAKLTALDGDEGDLFGISVALFENTAAIGANVEDNANGENAGSVYIFRRNGTSWAFQGKLIASDGEYTDQFGSSVALDAETLLIGARQDDDNGNNSGSAYAFLDDGLNPTPTAPPDPTENLIVNGGFENTLAGWTLKNGSSDKIKCNKTDPPKEFTPYGECTFIFKGAAGETSKLEQKPDLSAIDLGSGNNLTLSGFYYAKGSPNLKIKVVVKYTNVNLVKGKITTSLNPASNWTALTGNLGLTLTGIPAQIKIGIGNKSTSGKIRLDELKLMTDSNTRNLIDLPAPAQ